MLAMNTVHASNRALVTERPMKKTAVMVVDDHHLVCVGLKAAINAQPDLSVVTEATSGRHALEQLRTLPTDVLLLDLRLPDISGMDVLRYVRSHYPLTTILVHSAYSETQYGVNVLRAGASGFISKGAELHEFLRALRTVARGGLYAGPELTALLVDQARAVHRRAAASRQRESNSLRQIGIANCRARLPQCF
jgi:DNA-binding NarL/FixJ family response regulator